MPVLLAALGLLLTGPVKAQPFTTIHSFTALSYSGMNSDGAYPRAGLVLAGNNLYGTANGGGNSGAGTVFSVNTNGTGFTNLHSFAFTNSDGAYPRAGLILSGHTLYGTSRSRGGLDGGTVFAVKTDGTSFTNLHSFPERQPDGSSSEGKSPAAPLVLSGNTLYGTAEGGGSGNLGNGTVFAVNTDGSMFTNLHGFTGGSDGAAPQAGLILSGHTLYGTASRGGVSGAGTVFAINTDGTGFKTLHGFTAVSLGSYPNTNGDGAHPQAGLVLAGNTLYGTASGGGSSGSGTVFAVNTDGTGFKTLYSFTAANYPAHTNSDGVGPGGLILSGNTLYGAAGGGGSSGNGTVFAVRTNGTGFTTLYSFTPTSRRYPGTNSDGANPYTGLVLSGDTLYGTTTVGGNAGNGTVFSLSLGSTPPTVSCSAPLILECEDWSAFGTVQAEVQDTNGNALQVVWTVDATPSQTNTILPEGSITASNVAFTANFELGEHVVAVSASNGRTEPVTCSTTVTVHDTTPPQIVSILATPNLLWPPNHRMIPVNLMIEAVDNCDPSPVIQITSVMSNEPQNPFAPDWEIIGATGLNLKAERLGKGLGRVYTIVVQCQDLSGNVSTASVDVIVPHY